MLEEIDHAGRENLDAAHVKTYDLKEAWDATLEVELLVRLGLDETSHVVDMGAGTGQLTMAVAPRCRRVVAVDISPLMLDRLRAKAAAAGATNVESVHAGFLSYAHQGAPADVVFSRWALHHLPDLWKVMALDRIRAVLRPGGILRLLDIAFSFDPADAADAIERWCSTLPVEAATEGAWVRADIEEHVRDEHSTFTWLLEPMIERSGFTIEEAVRSPDGIYAEYVARAT
jgi:ubiquinone/menaquinone biosynthesis C-methylase UbiE